MTPLLLAEIDKIRWQLAAVLKTALQDQITPLRIHRPGDDFYINRFGTCSHDPADHSRRGYLDWNEMVWEQLACVVHALQMRSSS